MARILREENLYLPSMGYGGRGYFDDRGNVVEDGIQSDVPDIVRLMYRLVRKRYR